MTERSRAAMHAASQVEAIVDAAERAAAETRRKAELEAKQILDEARATSRKELDGARGKARQLGEEARKDAAGKIAEARAAADAVLEEAQALSASLKAASAALTAQADKLVRDVQLTHRELLAELRLPGVVQRTRGEGPQPPSPSEVFEMPDWSADR